MGALAGLPTQGGSLGDIYQSLDTGPMGGIDDGALEARANPLDPQHSQYGDMSKEAWPAGYGVGFVGQGTYYAGDSDVPDGEYNYPGVDYNGPPGMELLDRTPTTHGGEYPRPMATYFNTNSADEFADVNEQIALLHYKDKGGVAANVGGALAGLEYPTDYTTDRYDAPNETVLASNIPGQIRGGMGGGRTGSSADTVQGYGQLNTVGEFQMGHSIRRVQHDTAMFDHTLGHGETGTWLGKHPVGIERQFAGPDSPYDVYGDSSTGVMRAGTATTLGYPTVYTTPPSPTVIPDSPGTDVWAYGY